MTMLVDQRDWSGYGWARPEGVEVQLIVVHRTGNPRATALGNLAHSRRTRKWSIHHIVDEVAWYDVVPHSLVAWHVKEPRIVAKQGYPTELAGHEARGDVAAVGIEVCENHAVRRAEGTGQKTIVDRYGSDGWPALFPSPSQTMRFDPATYANLVEGLRRLVGLYPDATIVGHGHCDPWTRNTDPFGLLPKGWHGLLEDVRRNEDPAGSEPYRELQARYRQLEDRVDKIDNWAKRYTG